MKHSPLHGAVGFADKGNPLRAIISPARVGSRIARRAGSALALSLLGWNVAVAAPTNTFVGGGTVGWSDPANWGANGVPVVGGNSTLAIAINPSGTFNNDLGNGSNQFTLNSLLFNNGSGGYALSGAVLNFAGSTPSLMLDNTSAVSIASTVSLTSSNLTMTGAGTLNLSGTVTGAGSSVATATGQILVSGTGTTVNFSGGANTNLLAITGASTTTSFLGGTYTFNATDTASPNSSFRVDSQGSQATAAQANIQGGATVSTVYTYIARAVNSFAGTTVSGAGSQLIASKQIIVGSNAGSQGMLTVSGGGTARAASQLIGNGAAAGVNPASSGTVTVTGNGSTFTSVLNGATSTGNTGNITVGSSGTGVLTLSAGGSASASAGGSATNTGSIFIGNNAGSNGTVNVNAAGVSTGGGAVTTLAATGALAVGFGGTGTLAVQGGGTVSAGITSLIGGLAGSVGTATVNGASSSVAVTTGFLIVGSAGTGTLTLDTGGAASGANIAIGDLSGSNGTINVSAAGIGAGGAVTTLSTGALLVGNNGAGQLVIQGGGTVSTGSSSAIAARSGSTGTVTVSGTGSSLAVTGQLQIGGQGGTAGGVGQLTVASGAVVSSSDSLILYSGGSLSIDNASVTAGNLSIGNQSSGNISITNNGSFTFGGANTSTNYSGVISGVNGNLTKTGTGTIALSGTSTFSGTTQVNGGTMISNGTFGAGTTQVNAGALVVNGTLGAAGQTTVASGATLLGAGSANNIVLNGGATIAPGGSAVAGSVGTLGGASLAWNPGGILSFDIGAGTDALNLTGALTKGSTGSGTGFNFNFANNGITSNQFYDLIQFDTINGFTASDFSYIGLPVGAGNFVIDTSLKRVRFLTGAVVPECPTLGLLIVGTVFVIPLWRYSRRAGATMFLKGFTK